MNRDRQLRSSLFLADSQNAAADMLPSHAHDIGASLPSIEQKRERQSRARPNRVMVLEPGNLFVGSAMEAVRFRAECAHILGRIVSPKSYLDSVFHHGSQHLPKLVCCLRLVGPCPDQANDVLTADQRGPLVTEFIIVLVSLLAEPVDQAAIDPLGPRLQRA